MNNVGLFLPFLVLIGAMFLMTRSAKNKQRQAANMRDQMQPGTGIRTIGGMYATVKEVGDDTVLLEVAPGVHAIYAKNAVGAVLEDSEYNRIVHGIESDDDLKVDGPVKTDGPVVPDDASSLISDGAPASADGDKPRIDLGKSDEDAEDGTDAAAGTKGAAEAKDGKKDGDADAK
ncbi:preprotein translocase subunit YajC [Streptomyces sp. NPDC047108]|uniref:preprotein translocase subunit YajC n=1 Tax=Streptomyces sp. NPDC047108 TaxID=3155025 RepID=UPI0033EEB275